jgi:hypothetical protein
MGAYNDIDTKLAGLKQGLDSRVVSRRSSQAAGLDFGYPVFGYAGNEKDVFLFRNNRAKILWDADFVTGNSIDITVDGTAVTTVPFNTDHDTTMDDVAAQIEADIAGSSVTLIDTGGNNRDIYITIEDDDNRAATEAVTGGASQASGTITYDSTMIFEGISMFSQREAAQKVDANGVVLEAATAAYPEKEAANVMIDGWITVVTADAVVSKSAAYVVATGANQGKVTDSASGNTALTGATIDEDVSAAGLAIVRINK